MIKSTAVILLFCSVTGFAQNYSCLQFGPKNYFINGNNYVRGIRIDSTHTSGTDLIYYPYHTLRISNYLNGGGPSTPVVDTNGASWLGKKVIQQADGTFLFDNLWDTVIIKTQAHTGDSWIFFNDTTRYSYTATVTSEGTMTVLGTMDSIKTITITADSSGIAHPIDPVNNFQIILSKNNGFVQVFDLYTFPYHRRDTVIHNMDGDQLYLRWFDYYLDVVLNNLGTCDVGCPDNLPDTTNSIFHLFSFHNPRDSEIYNFAAGDIYESLYTISGPSTYYRQYTLDSVFSKTISPYAYTYTGTEHQEALTMLVSGYILTWDTTFDAYPFAARGDTSFLVSPVYLPEEMGVYLLHYYPAGLPGGRGALPGALYCDSPASYEVDADFRGGGFAYDDVNYAPAYYSQTYSIGFGLSGISGYNPISFLTYSQCYYYYLKNGSDCGNLFPISTVGVAPMSFSDLISISPNPATDYLTVATTNTFPDNTTIAAYDMNGRCVYSSTGTFQKSATISTASWQDGVYILVIQNDAGITKREKVVIIR